MTDRVIDLTREELTTLIRQIVRDELQATPRSYRIGQATPENWQAVLASFIPTPSPELAPVRLLLEERDHRAGLGLFPEYTV